jgi:hypothetical protein
MQLKNYISGLLFMLGILGSLNGQDQAPPPAPAQTTPFYIEGATAHLGNGQRIENSIIAFSEGRITHVGTKTSQSIDLSKYKRIEATGKHVYPAFIAPATTLGLVDISAVRATRDYDEAGAINPNVRSIIAYNTDSPIIPTIRSRGILLAQVSPQGGRVSGTSSIVQLDAWNWEDAAYKMDDGIFLNWPRSFKFTWQTRSFSSNEKYADEVKELEDYFIEAKAYAENPALRKST